MPKHSALTKKLLERGSVSYFEAVRAFREFRGEVLSRSRAALESRLDGLSRALGKKLDRKKIRYQALPNLAPEARGEEDYADLCAYLDLGSDCLLFVGLEWRRKVDTNKVEVLAIVSVWIKADKLSRCWQKLQASDPNLVPYGQEIYLQEACPRNEIANFQVKLERMLDRWCVIWQKTGGIASITKKQ
jgi:hypothetical protein